MSSPQGICPICFRTLTLKWDGMETWIVRRHMGRYAQYCPGQGCYPLDESLEDDLDDLLA